MPRPMKCPVRLSPSSNQRLHGDHQVVWLKVAPGAGTDYKLTRPYCRGCTLDLDTAVCSIAASVMEFYSDQAQLHMDAAIVIESITQARDKVARSTARR